MQLFYKKGESIKLVKNIGALSILVVKSECYIIMVDYCRVYNNTIHPLCTL